MFISVTFCILSFRTLPFIPQKKIRIEFSANYPFTTFRIPRSAKYTFPSVQRSLHSAIALVITLQVDKMRALPRTFAPHFTRCHTRSPHPRILLTTWICNRYTDWHVGSCLTHLTTMTCTGSQTLGVTFSLSVILRQTYYYTADIHWQIYPHELT